MRTLLSLAFLGIAAASPHEPDETTTSPAAIVSPTSPAAPPPAATPLGSPPKPVAPPPPKGTLKTPAGCRSMNTDDSFPAYTLWTTAFGSHLFSPQDAQGVRPDYQVQAHSVRQVQDAINFANQHNVRFSVIGSGHDFLGRSWAPSGVNLDLSQLKGIEVHTEFTPNNAPLGDMPQPSASATPVPGGQPGGITKRHGPEESAVLDVQPVNIIKPVAGKQAAVTFGAGISTQELNDALDKSGLFSMGAGHGEVRVAGGWGQTAGHSVCGTVFGMGVDQVLEYEVVTADGRLVVANSKVNPDLFWALRGGGGGSFGVVTKATVKVYPTPKLAQLGLWINSTTPVPGDDYYNALAYLHSTFPDINNKYNVAAYTYMYYNLGKYGLLTMNENATEAKLKEIFDPIVAKLKTFKNISVSDPPTYTIYPKHKNWFDYYFGSIDGNGPTAGAAETHLRKTKRQMEGMGDMDMAPKEHAIPEGMSYQDSRLMDAASLKHRDLAKALKATLPNIPDYQLRGHLVVGNKIRSTDPRAQETSMLPAWRKSYYHLVATGSGNFTINPIRRISPGMGAYVNEGSEYEANWKSSFWGNNYNRLAQIKDKYDPNGLFWVTPGINADKWEVREGKRLCKKAINLNLFGSDMYPPALDGPFYATNFGPGSERPQ